MGSKILKHLDHIECLEVFWHGTPPGRVSVECAQCGEEVILLFDEADPKPASDQEDLKKKLWWLLFDRDNRRMDEKAKSQREELLGEIIKVVS